MGIGSAEEGREHGRAALAEQALDHRLDLRADLIGEAVDEQAILGGRRTVRLAEIDRCAELTYHLLGSGSRPAGPSHGNVGVTGSTDAMFFANHVTLPSIGAASSAPTTATGMIGAPVRQRELDEPAAPEPLQPVAVLPQLAHPLFTLGKRRRARP